MKSQIDCDERIVAFVDVVSPDIFGPVQTGAA